MDFTLYENETAPEADVFTGPQTGLVKAASLAVMRGGVKAAKGAALLGSVAFPSEGETSREGRVIPRKEDFFRFIDERLDPAEKFWSPDPASLTTAGKVVSALGEMPLQLVGGLPGMAASITGNTGVQLVDEGVDAGTAGVVAAGMGVATTAMGGLPQAGSTLLKTGLFALLNPATGAATDLAARKALESQGYAEQAKAFDPFDPAARSVDMALGIVFGGVAHYGRWREKAPTAVVDAIDTVEKAAHAENLNPFEPGTAPAQAHGEALGRALDAVDEGRPVEVAAHFAETAKAKEPSYTAQRFRQDVKEVFGVNDEQADAALALVAARARVEGKELDGWIAERIAGVEQGAPEGAQLFQDRPIVAPFYSKVLAEVERLQQEKWSGPELLAKLKKTAGVKAEELAWTGLEGFLGKRDRVSKEEVGNFLAENQVRVQEVVKEETGSMTFPQFLDEMGYTREHYDGMTPDERSELHELYEGREEFNPTRYSSYVLPGGEGYRELLLTLPQKGAKPYRSSHFDEGNVLAHVRFNERSGAAGERILHLEEVQSDWHQERRAGKDVPDAPFAKNWHELVMKRMLRWAAEHGFDRVTWTTGEQQADRYDISKKVDAVRYYEEDGTVGLSLVRGGKEIGRHTIPETALNDAVGKELAEKIRKSEGIDTAGRYSKELSGVSLKTGGDGMKGFYDGMLPQFTDKWARKFGGKVEPVQIGAGADTTAVHSVAITDAMRDALLYEGQPLFQGEKGAVSFLADGRAMIHGLEAPDFTTLVHEVAHVFEGSLSNIERRELDTWLHSQVPGAKWSTQQRELFARAFERYLAEGKAPVAELQGVFEKFKSWLLEVYQRITGTAIDVRLNDNVRAIFDRMLFADQIKKARTPEAVKLQEGLQPHMQDLQRELRDTWGDEVEETGAIVVPSQPNAEQYDQTVYRGVAERDALHAGGMGRGTYFTSDPEIARSYAEDFSDVPGRVLSERIRLEKPYYAETLDDLHKLVPESAVQGAEHLSPNELEKRWQDEVTARLQRQGYDGIVLRNSLNPRTGEYVRADEVVKFPAVEPSQPTRMTGPLGDPLDVSNSFARNPRQVPEMLSTFLQTEARALETAESGKHVFDGHQKSATWSDAPEWYLERNRALRELGSNPVSKESTVNALRKAARGEWDKLTPGQQDMVLEAVHHVGGQIDAMSREITGAQLQPGDSFTTTHLERRVVVGERDGRLILDSGETIPGDGALRIVGEVDSTGRIADAPTTAADIILKSRGDFEISDGTNADGSPRLRSATEMLTEARDAVVIEQNRKPLYHRAAVCMGLG